MAQCFWWSSLLLRGKNHFFFFVWCFVEFRHRKVENTAQRMSAVQPSVPLVSQFAATPLCLFLLKISGYHKSLAFHTYAKCTHSVRHFWVSQQICVLFLGSKFFSVSRWFENSGDGALSAESFWTAVRFHPVRCLIETHSLRQPNICITLSQVLTFHFKELFFFFFLNITDPHHQTVWFILNPTN